MPINMTDWADGDLITKDRLNQMKNEAASVAQTNLFAAVQRAPTPPTGDDDDLVNRKYYQDNLPAGGGGGNPATEVALGDMAGATLINFGNTKSVNAYGKLTANATLAPSNVPSTGMAILTLRIVQDATGGRTLTFPSGTTYLNGSDGSIADGANEESIVTLVTVDGGTSWLAAIADVRSNEFEDFYWSFAASADVIIGFIGDRTLDFSLASKLGTGTVTAYKSTNGGSTWGSALSGSVSFASSDALKISATGVSGFCSYTVPRVA